LRKIKAEQRILEVWENGTTLHDQTIHVQGWEVKRFHMI